MTINRSALRRNSATDLLAKIKDSAAKTSGGNNNKEDSRMWNPTVDQSGNGFAVIRFLPARTEDSLPYVKQYNHGFKVGTKWFINLCPTTIGEPSPVVEHCNELWESGFEDDKKLARERKRKLRYFSNILVVKDPKNPENEGQVKIFTYGQKIYEKLMAVINPPEEFGESPRDPFSFFDGCVVKLKIRKKDGFRNFDESTVEPAGDLFDGDEDQLEAILDKLHDIDALNAPSNFKSYDELKTQYLRLTGGSTGSNEDSPASKRNEEKRSAEKSMDYNERIEDEAPKQSKAKPKPSDDVDDDLAAFEALVADD